MWEAMVDPVPPAARRPVRRVSSPCRVRLGRRLGHALPLRTGYPRGRVLSLLNSRAEHSSALQLQRRLSPEDLALHGGSQAKRGFQSGLACQRGPSRSLRPLVPASSAPTVHLLH
mmetsp:Transcript_14737/g.32383  ORF Transcript_14737/g.32383 Transcript_14737/m.32383 type:complete len:115 (-) Transcript_14737:1633-1977(-)